MTIDYGPPETERRERWLLAIGLAVALQGLATTGGIVAGGLGFVDAMGGVDIDHAWLIGIAIVSVCAFVASGWLAARITRSWSGWLVLIPAPLCALTVTLIADAT